APGNVSADAVEAPTWPIAQTIAPKPAICRKIPPPKGNSPPLQRESRVPARAEYTTESAPYATVARRKTAFLSRQMEKSGLGHWRNTKSLIVRIDRYALPQP